jgi:hypothetical protein
LSDPADVAYREMRQQIAEQTAEIERVDRKAAALLTPLGLLIGLALNSRSLVTTLRPVDALLFAGLTLELLALVAAVVALWPRKFRRPVPGSPRHRMAIGKIDATYFDPDMSPWRRLVSSVGQRLVTLGYPVELRRVAERNALYPPTWVLETGEATMERLAIQLAGAWRINASLLIPKAKWVSREYLAMLSGSLLLAAWFVLVTLMR